MVIDTSALIAILEQEPEAQAFANAIAADPLRLVSAASVVEAGLVMLVRRGEPGGKDFDASGKPLRIDAERIEKASEREVKIWSVPPKPLLAPHPGRSAMNSGAGVV